MPLTIMYDHPENGLTTVSGVTKLEGVFFHQSQRPTHYALFVGREPYEHRRTNFLVPVGALRSIKYTSQEAGATPEDVLSRESQ